jgi:hypothetical protein
MTVMRIRREGDVWLTPHSSPRPGVNAGSATHCVANYGLGGRRLPSVALAPVRATEKE